MRPGQLLSVLPPVADELSVFALKFFFLLVSSFPCFVPVYRSPLPIFLLSSAALIADKSGSSVLTCSSGQAGRFAAYKKRLLCLFLYFLKTVPLQCSQTNHLTSSHLLPVSLPPLLLLHLLQWDGKAATNKFIVEEHRQEDFACKSSAATTGNDHCHGDCNGQRQQSTAISLPRFSLSLSLVASQVSCSALTSSYVPLCASVTCFIDAY